MKITGLHHEIAYIFIRRFKDNERLKDYFPHCLMIKYANYVMLIFYFTCYMTSIHKQYSIKFIQRDNLLLTILHTAFVDSCLAIHFVFSYKLKMYHSYIFRCRQCFYRRTINGKCILFSHILSINFNVGFFHMSVLALLWNYKSFRLI